MTFYFLQKYMDSIVIAIGPEKKKQFVTQKLHHPNYIKKAMYYHELLEKGHIESQTELAKRVGISRTNLSLTTSNLGTQHRIGRM